MPKKNKNSGILLCDSYTIQNICGYLCTEEICKLSALCKILLYIKNYVTCVKTNINISPKQIKCFPNLQILHLEHIDNPEHEHRKTKKLLKCVPNIKELYCGGGRLYCDIVILVYRDYII